MTTESLVIEEAEVSFDQIREEMKRRRRIYETLYELTPPNGSGERIHEAASLYGLFNKAIRPICGELGFVFRIEKIAPGFVLEFFEAPNGSGINHPYLLEKMKRAGWVKYRLCRRPHEDGGWVYRVHLLVSPNELDDVIPDVDLSVTPPDLVRIDADALGRAFDRLFDASIPYGQERFVARPDIVLRRFFGPNHDVDGTVDLLIGAGLAGWRDGTHGAVTSERLFLYPPKD